MAFDNISSHSNKDPLSEHLFWALRAKITAVFCSSIINDQLMAVGYELLTPNNED